LAERTGLEDAADATPRHCLRGDREVRLADAAPSVAEHHGASAVLVTADPVIAELVAALALRRSGADPRTLRRALRRIEELLDE
jgi:hypothetical protein